MDFVDKLPFYKAMIQANQISKHFGPQVLFEDVTFHINSGDRVGLVGRNGSGKSTLMKIILGNTEADSGQISIPKNYKLGALEQHISFTKETVADEVGQVLGPNYEQEIYKAEKILFGLGFTRDDLLKSPLSFSGGYQVRINLAKALVQNPDMLLLDEPTNYLDIVSLRWLKAFLIGFAGEVIIITHDREFMDSVCTHIIGINRKRVKKIKGDTAKFYEQILLDDTIYEQTKANQDRKRKEMENFINRFRAKASKATQAQSKMKQLNRMEKMDDLEKEAILGFSFHYKDCPGKTIANVEDVSFSYDGSTENELFRNLKFDIGKHDRIGIIGKNGKGKSTLLNVIAGELRPNVGRVRFHGSSHIGHFGQTNINRLHNDLTIAQEISESNPDLSNTAVRNIAGAMMFEGDMADKKISVLSGGEKSRVMLGKILAHPSNVLLLDEPTNHLDMESIEVLADEIENFPGAVVIVTHSEMLLKRLVNRLVIFHDGKAEYFYGNYEDFLEKIGWGSEEEKPRKKKKISRKEIKRMKSDLINERSRECSPLKEKINQLEEDISALENLMGKFTELISVRSQTGEDFTEASIKVGQISAKIEEKFELMESISEEHDKKIKFYDAQLCEIEALE